ncbi:hypothetical protein AAGT00_00435 (plasmid) [Streptomyces cavourensis]
MPHMLGGARAGQRGDEGVQQQREIGQRHAPGVAGRAGRCSGPGGDEVRIEVIFVVAGPKGQARRPAVLSPLSTLEARSPA